ncbi:MAG: glycogen-binding domain-containing protein [Desulfosarcina sp.]|nr:glycogen-binding domain-containing protein [Desulfobacterales bacterium]
MQQPHSKKATRRRRILFAIGDNQAHEVAVSGDFNKWNLTSHLMKSDGNGLWQKIMILPPGQYEYKFLVDGRWRTDPNNPDKCTNCFGTFNNVLRVMDNNP